MSKAAIHYSFDHEHLLGIDGLHPLDLTHIPSEQTQQRKRVNFVGSRHPLGALEAEADTILREILISPAFSYRFCYIQNRGTSDKVTS